MKIVNYDPEYISDGIELAEKMYSVRAGQGREVLNLALFVMMVALPLCILFQVSRELIKLLWVLIIRAILIKLRNSSLKNKPIKDTDRIKYISEYTGIKIAAIQYHLTASEKNIFQAEVVPTGKGKAILRLYTADNKEVITLTDLNMTFVSREGATEEILDIVNGIVYIPSDKSH